MSENLREEKNESDGKDRSQEVKKPFCCLNKLEDMQALLPDTVWIHCPCHSIVNKTLTQQCKSCNRLLCLRHPFYTLPMSILQNEEMVNEFCQKCHFQQCSLACSTLLNKANTLAGQISILLTEMDKSRGSFI